MWSPLLSRRHDFVVPAALEDIRFRRGYLNSFQTGNTPDITGITGTIWHIPYPIQHREYLRARRDTLQNLRKRLLEIIELFSGLPDINEMRTKTLELIRTLVWFDRSIFWLFDPLQHEPFASPVYKDMSATIIDRFNALGGFNADMAYQAARQKNIMLGRSTDILDYRIWTRQPIFNELFLPNDAYYQLGCNICEGFRLYGAICLYRGKTTGNFKPRDLHIMSMIYPHLLNRLRLQFCFETKMMRDDSLDRKSTV